jgi:small-conductance mechanosensitive channel
VFAVLWAVEPTDAEIVEACGEDPGFWCEQVYRWTDNAALGEAAEWLLDKPLRVLLIIIGAWVANRLVRRAIRHLADRLVRVQHGRLADLRNRAPSVLAGTPDPRTTARVQTITAVLRSLSTATIYTIAFIMVLGELGISIGPLIAGAGIAGVALGFGAQSLVKDFLTGIFMVLEDEYGVGDVIDVGDVGGATVSGVVEGVGLRTTRLRSADGTVWHVPNGEVRRVGNMSQQWSRALLDVAIASGSDIDRAVEVIRATAEALAVEPEWEPRILETPEVWGVERIDSDSITIRVVVKTTPGDQWALMRQLRVRLKAAFEDAGIQTPLPQRSVWLRTEPPGEPTP